MPDVAWLASWTIELSTEFDQAGLGLVGDRVADDDVITVLQHSRVVVALAHVGERRALGASHG